MPAPMEITIRIRDYAVIKSVLEAADAVMEAEGELPWTLSEAIGHLGRCMAKVDRAANNDGEDDGN